MRRKEKNRKNKENVIGWDSLLQGGSARTESFGGKQDFASSNSSFAQRTNLCSLEKKDQFARFAQIQNGMKLKKESRLCDQDRTRTAF
jgi:hypothetical protein